MVFSIELDISAWDRFSSRLKKALSLERVLDAQEDCALRFFQFIEDAPIPTDLGDLTGSYTVDRTGKEVIFGFNKVYAAFQDAKGRTEIVIRPKKKKFLYVPLNRKGRKHVEGRDPKTEGLVRGVDYTLRKSVKVPVKPYGSPIGPNKYFSGTLERKGDFFFECLKDYLERELRKAGK